MKTDVVAKSTERRQYMYQVTQTLKSLQRFEMMNYMRFEKGRMEFIC